MLRLFAVAFLTVSAAAGAGDRSPTEDARIEYLLAIVASLHDAQFIRNGTSYDGATAVKHLRLKLRAEGSRVKTAEDFIRYCASASSVSGRQYEIRFSDGRLVHSADFLRQKLMEFDKENERSGQPAPEGVVVAPANLGVGARLMTSNSRWRGP
jgi:hypothetical protein